MPAPPEVRYRSRKIRAVKILSEPDVEEKRGAQRHIRIARKIHIYLEGVGVSGKQQGQASKGRNIVIYGIDIEAEAVGNHSLLEQPPGEQEKPETHVVVIELVLDFQLRQEIGGPFYRPLQYFGEKCEV